MTTNTQAEVTVTPNFRDMAGDGVHAKVYDMTRYLVKGRQVLVMGAGEGAYETRLISAGIPAADIRSVDISPRHHKVPGIECQAADLNDSVPFPDKSFQMVYAVEVIEHLHRPKRLIEEAYRVLEPGGFLTISTPNPQSLAQRLRFLLTGKLGWFSEEDYLGSGHIYPIYDWVFERLYRGMFEPLQYSSQAFRFSVLPMPRSKLFAVNNIYVLRKLSHP
jgi:SAM-dependent methyltransferase